MYLHYSGILFFTNCVAFCFQTFCGIEIFYIFSAIQISTNFVEFRFPYFHKFCGILSFQYFPHILRNQVFNNFHIVCEFQFSTKLVENVVLVEFNFLKADDFNLRVRLAKPLCICIGPPIYAKKRLEILKCIFRILFLYFKILLCSGKTLFVFLLTGCGG